MHSMCIVSRHASRSRVMSLRGTHPNPCCHMCVHAHVRQHAACNAVHTHDTRCLQLRHEPADMDVRDAHRV
jgi:hypothetical protein